MEGHGGGSSTPSYSNIVSNRGREKSLNNLWNSTEDETKTTGTHKPKSSKSHEKEGTHKEAQKETKAGAAQRNLINHRF